MPLKFRISYIQEERLEAKFGVLVSEYSQTCLGNAFAVFVPVYFQNNKPLQTIKIHKFKDNPSPSGKDRFLVCSM